MKKYEDRDFEFRVRDIAVADRAAAGLPEGQSGVLVEAVREGGWAALGHLADGDVILAIDGDPVADVAAVQLKMERVARTKPPSVVLKVRRGIRTFFVEMQNGAVSMAAVAGRLNGDITQSGGGRGRCAAARRGTGARAGQSGGGAGAREEVAGGGRQRPRRREAADVDEGPGSAIQRRYRRDDRHGDRSRRAHGGLARIDQSRRDDDEADAARAPGPTGSRS